MSVSSDIILWKIHSRCPDFHLPANGFLLNDLKGRGQEKQNTEREKSRKKTNIAEVEAKEKTENRGAKKSREQAAVKKPEREKQKEAPEPKGPRR